ncbi:hypothetical protein ACVWZ4_007431 [Bradyrhizobium sp. USDA 4472]
MSNMVFLMMLRRLGVTSRSMAFVQRFGTGPQIRLHRLRLGPSANNKTRSLKMRTMTPSLPPVVGHDDPFFWRTLLEIFCRTYIAACGRPPEWSKERKVALGFDLIQIWEEHFKQKEMEPKGGFEDLARERPLQD